MQRKRYLVLAALALMAVVLATASALFVTSGVQGKAPAPASTPADATADVLPTLLPEPPSKMDAVAASWQPSAPNFLHTEGNKIVDSHGKEVRLTGVNWFGMETGTFAPHGLWERSWQSMLDQMADLGYNTIRLPFSDQMFDARSLPSGIDYQRNPDLRGLRPIQIMDKIIEGAGRRGMRVILDHHRSDIEKQRELWYTDTYSEERWIADWTMLAARYKGNDTVIGADLDNEPHGPATWGTGDPKTDWRLAAERAGNAILAVNPDWLILVEGIEQYNGDWFWWGANLAGVAQNPVRLNVPNRVVYSPHEYGPGVWTQKWFSDPSFPKNMPDVWNKYWGYINDQNIAPILVGEFGGRRVDNDSPEGKWQQAFLSYLKDKGMSYTYWAFNANSGDTGGILDEEDLGWQAVVKEKVAFLANYLWPMLPSGTANTIDVAAAPNYEEGIAKNAKLDGDLRVLYHPGESFNIEGKDAKSPTIVTDIRLENVGVMPLSLDGLEVRYWFKAEGKQQAKIQFASIGSDNVKAEVDDTNVGGQNHVLKITFAPGAGRILGKGGDVDLEARISNADGRPYTQAGDYSFDPNRNQGTVDDFFNIDNFNLWERIALYSGGKLIWGAEPRA